MQDDDERKLIKDYMKLSEAHTLLASELKETKSKFSDYNKIVSSLMAMLNADNTEARNASWQTLLKVLEESSVVNFNRTEYLKSIMKNSK